MLCSKDVKQSPSCSGYRNAVAHTAVDELEPFLKLCQQSRLFVMGWARVPHYQQVQMLNKFSSSSGRKGLMSSFVIISQFLHCCKWCISSKKQIDYSCPKNTLHWDMRYACNFMVHSIFYLLLLLLLILQSQKGIFAAWAYRYKPWSNIHTKIQKNKGCKATND